MPRYFITTASEALTATDPSGIEVPDLASLDRLLRQSVAEMLLFEGQTEDATAFTAHATDERGALVLSATVRLTMSGPASG